MNFAHSDLSTMIYLSKSYDPLLVIVSVVIAIISSFTAFSTAERALNSPDNYYKLIWLSFGGISLGLGIWAMHFIGMLALTLPVSVNYSVGITALSIVPGIAASAVVLWSMMHHLTKFKHALLGGILFGTGVTVMHLIGMSAMQMNAMMAYHVPILIISVLSAIIFATIALHLQVRTFATTRQQVFNKYQFVSAVVMGMAISSMHYTAMYATNFTKTQEIVAVAGISAATLATIISISVLIVIVLSFLIPTLLATQYKRVAAELNKKFQSALARKVAITDSAYDAWVHINQNGEILGWNKSAETILGWTEQEALGRSLSQLIIPPRYRSAHDNGLAHFLASGRGSILNKILELQAQHKDGHIFPVEITVTAISLDDGYEFSAFMRDITERKQTEAKQAKLMRELQFEKNALDAHAIVGVTDVKGDIIYTNERFEQISKFSRAELLGQNYRIVKSSQHSAIFFKNMWRTIASGDIWHGVIKNRAKDGSDYWVALTIVPFLDEKGKPIRYISIGTDISEQKALERRYEDAMAEVLQEKKVAERANRAKSDFLASMSHELRTPLNAILGFAQLMKTDTKDPINEAHREELNYIVDSGKHLLSLINNVLDLAQIESGRSVVSLESIQLDDVVNEAVALVQNMAEQKQISLINVAKDRALSVIADYTKLKQAMINLISNSIKYNHEGGVVQLDYYICANNAVRITVTDDGIGIAKENHHRIFSAFDRLGQETSNIEGTGVGLLVTKNIVELMGGKIDFDKQKKQGATFWIELPLALEQRSDQQQKRELTGQKVTKASFAEIGKKQILCVEDNPINQQLMTSFLALYPNLNVRHAASAELAWQLFQQHHFDLVLMDINLPEMDGITLASKIRNLKTLQSTTPMLAVSAMATKNTIEETQGLFEAYVTKPVDFELLSELIQTYLG